MTPLQSLRKLRQMVSDEITSYKCNKTINALIADTPTSQRLFYKTLLANQLSWLLEQNFSANTHQQYLNLTKKVIGNVLEIGGIVGIQPLDDPLGLVYRMNYTTNEISVDSPIQYPTSPLTMEVTCTPIIAMTRKLIAAWKLAPANRVPGTCTSVEQELLAAMAYEISQDILLELLQRAFVSANTNISASTSTNIVHNIKTAASQIAFKTRRGAGNVIITSPTGLSLLAMVDVVIHDDHTNDKPLYYTGTAKVGDATFSVYVSNSYMFSSKHNEMFLIAYKGGVNELDCGMIYSPYQVLLPNGPSIDPRTFEPCMTVFTRYNIQEYTDTTPSTGDYYATVTVTVPDQKEK